MKIPRDLSGQDLIQILCKNWGYRKISQEGSHIILTTEIPTNQRIAIPNHTFLRIGTLNSILRSIALHKNISKSELLQDLK